MTTSSSTVPGSFSGSPHLAGRQMSSSLKEKLKKMGRSRSSPIAAHLGCSPRSKPLSISTNMIIQDSPLTGKKIMVRNVRSPQTLVTEDYKRSNDEVALQSLKVAIEISIAKKREELRKLEMAKLYRTKNNLKDLDKLITKWRQVSQEGLEELQNRMPEPKTSLTDLIDYLQIDHKLIGYVAEDESFIS